MDIREHEYAVRIVEPRQARRPGEGPGALQAFAVVGGALLLTTGAIIGLTNANPTGLSSWIVDATKTALGAGAILSIGGLAKLGYDSIYARVIAASRNRLALQSEHLVIEAERVDLERRRLEAGIMVLPRDEFGRAGLTYDGQVYRDHDTRAAYTQELTIALNPMLEVQHAQLEAIRAMARRLPPNTYHVENIRGDQLLPGAEDLEALEAEVKPVTLGKHTLAELLTRHDFKPSQPSTRPWGSL